MRKGSGRRYIAVAIHNFAAVHNFLLCRADPFVLVVAGTTALVADSSGDSGTLSSDIESGHDLEAKHLSRFWHRQQFPQPRLTFRCWIFFCAHLRPLPDA